MQVSDDLYLGPAFVGGTNASDGPSPMTIGVGPLGRFHMMDVVPVASGATTTQNEISRSANLPLGALTLLANGTTTTAGFDPAGNAIVILDCERSVAVYSAADLSAQTLTITGYDRYGALMSQTITAPNATTVQTTKSFKSILSVVSSGAIASAVVVGIGTWLGFKFRITDLGYITNAMFNQTAIVISSTAIKVADQTSPATASTTDVRGIINCGQTNGTKRLLMGYAVPALAAGPNATRIGAVGVTQA